MGYIAIADSLGEPIEIESGLCQQFEDEKAIDKKSQFMRDYRLLPCDRGGRDLFICDDAREYDAMRSVMEACKRLAVFGGYGDCSKSGRKPEESDLGRVDGLEIVEGGAFLHINLGESYWYKRFLFCTLYREKLNREGGARLLDAFSANTGGMTSYDFPSPIPNIDIEGDFPGGTFLFCDDDAASAERGLDTGHALCGKSHDMRRDFLAFADGGAWSDVEFWDDSEMIVRAAGENPEGIAANIADILLALHTESVSSLFRFDVGYWLVSPIGLSALWSDFALGIAEKRIVICKYCGAPIVANRKARGVPREYCNDNCRKKYDRRNPK